MPGEDDADEVPGFALLPVVSGVDGDDGGDAGVLVGARDLEADHAVVRDRVKGVDGVQLAPLVEGVVRAVGPQTHFEAQVRVVAQVLGDARDVLAGDEDAELSAVDGHLFDDIGNLQVIGNNELFEDVNDLVKPSAVGAGGLAGQEGIGHEAGEAGGGGVGARAEEALAVGDGLGEGETALGRGLGDLGGRVVLGDGKVAHARSPFIWWVGVASRAACSARRAISRRWTPRGSLPICSRRTRTAWMRASGRGGQPGR